MRTIDRNISQENKIMNSLITSAGIFHDKVKRFVSFYNFI